MAKQKVRAPQDTTLRNLRALKKRLALIEARLTKIETAPKK